LLIRPGSSGLFEKLRILERSVAESRDDLRTLVRLGIERRRRGDVSGAYDAFLGARALSRCKQQHRDERETQRRTPATQAHGRHGAARGGIGIVTGQAVVFSRQA